MSVEDLFKKYKKSGTFIETGSNVGNGIYNALRAGYDNVTSIENNKLRHMICHQRFGFNEKVHLILGNSAEAIEALELTESVTFWLDAHPMLKPIDNTIVLKEIAAIGTSNLKHTIIVNDMDVMSSKEVDKAIKKLNKKYKSKYVTLVWYLSKKVKVYYL